MTWVVGLRQGRGGCVAGKLITGGVCLQEECGRVCQQCSHHQQQPSQTSQQPSWSQSETSIYSTHHKFEMQWRRIVWFVERQFDHWWIWDESLAKCLDQQSCNQCHACSSRQVCVLTAAGILVTRAAAGVTTAAWSQDVSCFYGTRRCIIFQRINTKKFHGHSCLKFLDLLQ